MSGWGGRRVTQLRKQMEAMLPVPCARCGQPVMPGMAWDIGHTIEVDRAPDLMWEPDLHRIEHRYCNRAAGAAYVNRKRGQHRQTRRIPPTSQDW